MTVCTVWSPPASLNSSPPTPQPEPGRAKCTVYTRPGLASRPWVTGPPAESLNFFHQLQPPRDNLMSQKPISCLTTTTQGLATGRRVPVTLQGVYAGSWYSYSLGSLEAGPEEVKKKYSKNKFLQRPRRREVLWRLPRSTWKNTWKNALIWGMHFHPLRNETAVITPTFLPKDSRPCAKR